MGAIIVICKNSQKSSYGINTLEYVSTYNIFTPHVTRSAAMPSFCRLELPLLTLWPYKDNKCVNEILFKTKFDVAT